MKRLLCLTAAFGLIATCAFGQEGMQGMEVSFKDMSTADKDSAALVDVIVRALDKSRDLHLVPTVGDEVMQVAAPVSVVKEADGARLSVRYEITPPRGSGREFTATCAPTQLQRCADTIVQRAERLAREAKLDAEAGRAPN